MLSYLSRLGSVFCFCFLFAGDVLLTGDKSVALSVSGVELGNDAPLPPTGREGGGKKKGSRTEEGKKEDNCSVSTC